MLSNKKSGFRIDAFHQHIKYDKKVLEQMHADLTLVKNDLVSINITLKAIEEALGLRSCSNSSSSSQASKHQVSKPILLAQGDIQLHEEPHVKSM